MALKSTIFRATLNVSDLDRGYFAEHALTLARHPSETDERMMVRILAFALHGDERLQFGRGISTDDEPALWLKDDSGQIVRWIEVGLPDERLLRRACGKADEVIVLAYGGGGRMCGGRRIAATLSRLPKLACSPWPRKIPAPAGIGRTQHGTQLHGPGWADLVFVWRHYSCITLRRLSRLTVYLIQRPFRAL
jgi:hypothetical protein